MAKTLDDLERRMQLLESLLLQVLGNKNQLYTSNLTQVPATAPADRRKRTPTMSIPQGTHSDILKALTQAGLSIHTLTMIANKFFKQDIRQEKIGSEIGKLSKLATGWLARNFTEDYWAIIAGPCYYPPTQSPGVMVIGISGSLRMSVLAFVPGDADDGETWAAAVAKLKLRGLSGVKLAVLPYNLDARAAVQKRMPGVTISCCWLSATDYAAQYCGKGVTKVFRTAMHAASYLETKKEIREAFKALRLQIGECGGQAIDIMEQELDNLTNYLKFEKAGRRVTRSTYVILKQDRDLRKRTLLAGTTDEEVLMALLAFFGLRLEFHWQKFTIDSEHLSNLMGMKAIQELD